MRKILALGLFIGLIIVVSSCSDKNRLDGDWDDCIKLSAKDVDIAAIADSVIIKTEGTGWWITDVGIDDDIYHDFEDIDVMSDKYAIEIGDIVVKRRDKKTLVIVVNDNPFDSERVINIGLEAGDYFDNVTVTQKAK